MPRTVSATEAKTHMGAILKWAVEQREDVIIESHRRPTAVIINYEEYQKIQRLRETARRQDALKRLETLAQQMRSQNQDMTQEQAEEMADRFSREVIEEMVEEGKIAHKGA